MNIAASCLHQIASAADRAVEVHTRSARPQVGRQGRAMTHFWRVSC